VLGAADAGAMAMEALDMQHAYRRHVLTWRAAGLSGGVRTGLGACGLTRDVWNWEGTGGGDVRTGK